MSKMKLLLAVPLLLHRVYENSMIAPISWQLCTVLRQSAKAIIRRMKISQIWSLQRPRSDEGHKEHSLG